MSRQIDPKLFGTNSFEDQQKIIHGDLRVDNMLESQGPGPFYDDLLERLEKTKYQVAEWVNSLNLKIDKINQRFHSTEERLKQASVENHERLAHVASRIKDRNNSDLKVEALIERHNQIVQSFELRLSQAQRLIENQALQLAKQQELIDEARRQIEKLKKL